jgi:cold shock CspA family protein
MDARRYEGKLKKWHTERGFGFIVAADGGQDIFVHISAFARDGRMPLDGEVLTFEIEPDRNGRRSAVRVRRQGSPQPGFVKVARMGSGRTRHTDSGSGWVQKLMIGLLLVAMGLFAYSRYENRVRQIEAASPSALQSHAPATLLESAQPAPASFGCDGRRHCSQMTSCKEATLFLKNCPGVEMDGNHDGVPCEQQWCTHPWAE